MITFCYDIMQLGVFRHMVLKDEIWRETDPNQNAYWTQQNFLICIVYLLKLQDIQNHPKETRNGIC